MYRRQGYDESGINLTNELDIPMWSRKDLTATKPQPFFDDGAGPRAVTSLTTANKIDQNKDFDVKCIEVNVMRTTKAALEQAQLDLIGILAFDYWLQIFTNETNRSWFCNMSSLLKFPMEVAVAGASAYDPAHVVNGKVFINVPRGLVIRGGEAFTMQLNSEVVADDLTGLSMVVTLWGRLFAREKARLT